MMSLCDDGPPSRHRSRPPPRGRRRRPGSAGWRKNRGNYRAITCPYSRINDYFLRSIITCNHYDFGRVRVRCLGCRAGPPWTLPPPLGAAAVRARKHIPVRGRTTTAPALAERCREISWPPAPRRASPAGVASGRAVPPPALVAAAGSLGVRSTGYCLPVAVRALVVRSTPYSPVILLALHTYVLRTPYSVILLLVITCQVHSCYSLGQ